MKFRYVTVYRVRGLSHNPDEDDIEIYADKSENGSFRVIITVKPDPYCYDIDRAQSIGNLMLQGSIGKQGEIDEKILIENKVEQICISRKNELQGSAVLVLISEGEVQVDLSKPIRETEDYALDFDIINKDDIVSAHRNQIQAVLASLCLATERVQIQFTYLKGDVYLINELDKPVYSMGLSFKGEGYTSIPISADLIKETQNQFKLVNKKRALTKVYGLLSLAVSRNNDELRRFMSGWSALEILIKKVFTDYEKLFLQRLIKSDPTNQAGRYFESIRKVMKKKYNIVDQFVVIASCIGRDTVDKDVEEYIRIKKIRDALFHDSSMVEKNLPTIETVELLKKYLRLHLQYKSR